MIDMNVRTTHLLQLVGEISDRLFQNIRARSVEPRVSVAEIRSHLSRYDFAEPISTAALVEDVSAMLERWGVQVTSPRYFGLFNPSVHPVSIGADALVAAFNPQLAAWAHAPAANEIERHVLRFFQARLGLPDEAFASFVSGGQEANLSATIVALTDRCPEVENLGLRALEGDPVLYLSEQGHHSFQKVAHATGLGRNAVHLVPVDSAWQMRPDLCQAAIDEDRRAGRRPFMVVATAGATGTGAIDPLVALADLSQREQLWFHVDAAWGGAAVLSDRLRRLLTGIEHADSITWDAHKWLSVPLGAGMVFYRRLAPVARAFHVSGAGYVPVSPDAVLDPYTTTLQWSRRFIGLKVFMALAETGAAEYARLIESQAMMGDLLRDALLAQGWRIANHSPLAIVCATHDVIERGRVSVDAIVERVNGSGRAWVSKLPLPGFGDTVRTCITSYRTEAADVDVLVDELAHALEAASTGRD